jgi:serine/threonine protein kinase/tetratricopeptide (TPR) repeat protein
MTSESWEQIKQIFEAALELPASARARFVREACDGNNIMHEEVCKLLAADERAGSFLENQTIENIDQTPDLHLLSSGDVIGGRFEIIRFLGCGGMGDVYEARDLDLNDHLALKAIRPEIANDESILARFKREIQLARRVTHPNVCRIFDLGHHEPEGGSDPGITFLTMELLAGETLAQRMRRKGRLTTEEAFPLVRDMAEGIAAAHDVGVIHRDFKPSNVILVAPSGTQGIDDGKTPRAVITDFGLARSIAPEITATGLTHSVTGAGDLIGTIAYMAPEQLEGRELSAATDIYALGLVIYEMVTNQRPYSDGVLKRLTAPPLSPCAHIPGLELNWELAILRCLQIDPAARFQSTRELVASLNFNADEVDFSRGISRPQDRHPVHSFPSIFNRSGIKILLLLVFFLSLSLIILRHYVWSPTSLSFADQDRILVTDFDNQTGEKIFDRVVGDLVVQSLRQSNYVSVVSRLDSIEAAKRTTAKEVDRIDATLGRQICLRENYHAMITGAILKTGTTYRLEIAVADPRNGSTVIADSESMRSPEELYGAVDRLTGRLRRHLGESLARIEKRNRPLAQVTTPSLEALQRYSLAVDLCGDREFLRCIALAKDAVDLDPNFAMAHALLARAYDQSGNSKESHEEFQLARAGLDRAGERERHLILAMDYLSQGLDEKSMEEYQHLLDIYPDDVDALRGLSETAFWTGRITDAVNAQRRALQLNPSDPAEYDALMMLLIRTSQFEQALVVYEQARSHHLYGANLRFAAGLAAWGQGDLQTAQHAFELLREETSDYWKVVAQLYLGRLLTYEGRMREASQALRSGRLLVERPEWEDWIAVFQYLIAQTEVIRGRKASARTESHKLWKAAKEDPTPENLQRAGRLAIEVGDLESAEEFNKIMEQRFAAQKDAFTQAHFYNLLGDVNLARRRTVAAIENQERALTFHKDFVAYLSLGKACNEIKNWKCSIEAYKNYLQLKGEVLRDDFPADWVIAHYQLATAFVNSGNLEEGSHYYNSFLQLFSAADPDLPLLADARKKFRSLGEQSTEIGASTKGTYVP